MSAPETSLETTDERIPEDLVEAGFYRTATDGFAHGLVVLAMGRPYWLMPSDGGHRLLVEPAALPVAREQLARFDRESVGWPPQPIGGDLPAGRTEFITPLMWGVLVVEVFGVQGRWPGSTAAGALDTQAIFDRGEWWRPATALFLHADVGHLASNLLGGLLVFSAVVSTIGLRRGWLLLALASFAGNVAVAGLNYPGPYQSIGASTAVFAGLGLLTGRAIRVVERDYHPHRWRAMFVPLAAGLTVLALYGAGAAGGLQVDVLAHLTGFMAGLALGFVGGCAAGRLNRRRGPGRITPVGK